MKLLATLFLSILTSTFVLSQDFPEDNFEFVKPIATLRSTDTVVRDSVISRYYDDNGNLFVKAKIISHYDASAREILKYSYSWDADAKQLYLRQIDSSVFVGNTKTEWQFKAENATSLLLPTNKYTKTYEPGGEIELQINEFWDGDLNEWQLGVKLILITNEPYFTLREVYRWDNDLQEYYLIAKNEITLTDHSRVYTYFNYNTSSGYVPNYQYVYQYHPLIGLEEYYAYENYSSTLGDWITKFDETSFFDLENYTGYQLAKDRNSLDQDDELLIHDSTYIQYNAAFQRMIDSSYKRTEINESLELKRHRNRTYNSYGLLDVLSGSDYADGIVTPAFFFNYYYHTIVLSSLDKVQGELPVGLIFPNPCTTQDYIRVTNSEELSTELYLSLSDNQGRTLYRGKSNPGDMIPLNQFSLSSGMYYLTLQGNAGLKTWKLLVQGY